MSRGSVVHVVTCPGRDKRGHDGGSTERRSGRARVVVSDVSWFVLEPS